MLALVPAELAIATSSTHECLTAASDLMAFACALHANTAVKHFLLEGLTSISYRLGWY